MKHPAIWVIVPSSVLLMIFTVLMLDVEEVEPRPEPFDILKYSPDELTPLPEDTTSTRPQSARRAMPSPSDASFAAASPRRDPSERRALEYAISRTSSHPPRVIPVPVGAPPVSSQRPPRQFLTVGSIDLILADRSLNERGVTLDAEQRTQMYRLLTDIERELRVTMRAHVQTLDECAQDLRARGETVRPDENDQPPEPRFEGELIRTVGGANGPEYVRIDPSAFPNLRDVESSLEHQEQTGIERVRTFLSSLN